MDMYIEKIKKLNNRIINLPNIASNLLLYYEYFIFIY